MIDRVDIGDQLQELVNKLGFADKKVVAEIHIGVREVTVLYYPLNENGHKYVSEDGFAATRWRRFQVST